MIGRYYIKLYVQNMQENVLFVINQIIHIIGVNILEKVPNILGFRGGPLMIGGGGLRQKLKKNSTVTRPGKKNSTQQRGRKKKLNSTTQKKKNSIQQPERRKLNSTTWKKKKFIKDLMLGCEALKMDIHAFYILFRYK